MSEAGGGEAKAEGLVFALEKKNVVLAKKAVVEQDRVARLDKRIQDLEARIKATHGSALKQHRAKRPGEYMSKLGSATAMEDMKRRQLKEIKLLEREQNRATKMFDRVNDACAKLRHQIDDRRKDAMNQNGRFATMSKALDRIKLEMAKVLELANQVDAEKREIAEEYKRCEEAAQKEEEAFRSDNWEVLTWKAPLQSKRREKVGDVDVGTAGMTPGQRIRKRLKEISLEMKAVREDDQQVAKEMEKYEAAFEALRRCTGLSDLDDIVAVFTEEEDRKLRQMQLIQDMNDNMKSLELERKTVEAEKEAYRKQWGSFDAEQKARIADFEERLGSVKQEVEETDAAHRSAEVDLDKYGDVIHRLFHSLECEDIGVDTLAHSLTVHRERRASFFGPLRRGSEEHKEALTKLMSQKDREPDTNPSAADPDAVVPETAQRPSTRGMPSPHRHMILAVPGDDEVSGARTMGTPTRSGTRQAAFEEVNQMIQTGVTHSNVQRYMAIVEQRVVALTAEFQQALGETRVSTPTLPREGRLAVVAPPMEDFEGHTNDVDSGAAFLTQLDTTLTRLSRKSAARPESPAWRTMTPALSPVGPQRPSQKKKTDQSLPKVVSRTELEVEVMRDFGELDLSQFMRKVRLEDDKPSGPPSKAGDRRRGTFSRPAGRSAGNKSSADKSGSALASAGSMSVSMS